ncbi:MAG: transposase [bacterium]
MRQWDKYLGAFLDVYAYCLLPTHYHFFTRVKEITSQDLSSFTKLPKFSKDVDNAENEGALDVNRILENQFKNFLRSYALAFNKENSRTGSLFEKGFKRIRVDNSQYFTAVIHYIHNNPIHHHCTDSYEKWRFSSYNSILSNKSTKVKKEEILEWFGSAADFIECHLENIKYEKIDKFLFMH